MKKTIKTSKDFYSMENYVPNKQAKPITVNGTQYKSKAQAMALENMTRKELDAYIKENPNCID